ncbi:hypothetical protein BDV59DRAFT_210712 [Aspergillus ambiguus]|uniref:uncharacterized protein n=1 Tax=Aspergillus ambiguus TaxID=176160 RepID=UPI003CCE51BF
MLPDTLSQPGYEITEAIKERITDLEKELLEKEKRRQIHVEKLVETITRETSAHKYTKQQVQSLEKAISEKNEALYEKAEETRKLTSHAGSLQTKYTNETEKVAKAQRDIKSLQGDITGKRSEINKLENTISAMKKEHAAATCLIEKLQAEISTMNGLLGDTRKRLQQLEGFATGFSEIEEDRLIDGYTFLWEYASEEIYRQMKVDLDSEVLRDNSAWEEIRNSELVIQHRIPIPRSNSPAAKCTRLALALAVLSREIDKYIFQPTYVLREDCQIRESLGNLAAVDSEKEAFCRSILFSLDSESQSKSCERRIRQIVQNVSAYFSPLLSDEQNDQLCRSLENVVHKAVDIWNPIQHARKKYESDFEQPENDEWAAFEFPNMDSLENLSSSEAQQHNFLIIFPRMSSIHGNEKILYTPIWQLSSMHPQWVAAEREMRQEQSSSKQERVTSTRLIKSLSRGFADGRLLGMKRTSGE